ncbi:MAG: C10 family peptidase [Muribaculaceae bacterium]|nr:C10 family peptidase [Muribaculaceae bacterium]
MRKFLLLIAMTMVAMQLSAADVDFAKAQDVAESFLRKQVATKQISASAVSNLTLAKAEFSVAKPAVVDYYIFNSDKAYVVVAGDDQAPEILMYGKEGAIDINNIPPAMQWLLNKYKYQIDGLKAGTFKSNNYVPKTVTAIAPLVTANWDQSSPYNNQCPTSGNSRAVTGCPATSLAMCYYKWKWPTTFPACSAISGTGGYSASALPERAADWDNIIDEYTGPSNYSSTSAQKTAVAWLMRYAGQSIPDYYYSSSASGADDPEIYQGVLNMGYTNAQYLMLTELVQSGWSGYTNSSQYYTDAQWNNYMMAELQAGNPIEYLAYDVSYGQVSGHAFNVFGCDSSGKYYVNWGWSGDSNGYCTLHNFTTATGATGQSGSYVFNYGEAMIIGIAPPQSSTDPTITVSNSSLSMTCNAGATTTATFTVTGANLTGNVTATLTDNNGVFSVSPTTISKNDATNGKTVTVTFAPQAGGTFNGTITLKSNGATDVTVSLTGTATKQTLSAPTLAAASNITTNSFTASWTYNPVTAVTYTLNVSRNGAQVLNKTGITDKNYTVTGLSPNTSYTFRVKAVPTNTNLYNESSWSSTKTVTTSEEIVPTITVNPASLDFGTVTAGQTVTKTFTVTGENLEGNISLALTDPNNVYTINTTSITTSQATSGKQVTVTFTPNENVAYNGTIKLTSANATTVNVALTGTGAYFTPVMQAANESYIKNTSFRADWTDATPANKVASYTLEVNYVAPEPEVELIASLAGTSFSGNNYYDITLPAPWGGTNVRGGNSSIIYFRNNYNNDGVYGNITYTIPEGYENATFTMKITSGSTSDGAGNLAVGTPQTASVNHYFTAGSTFAWVVTASSGEKITITTTDAQYSPDIALIEVYSGDATTLNLRAAETGDDTYRLIEGITDINYIVKNLLAAGTFTYGVKAIYTNGTESEWSNIETVTLSDQPDPEYILGDVDGNGEVDVTDVNILINIILNKDQAENYGPRAYVTDDDEIDVTDVNMVINIILHKI